MKYIVFVDFDGVLTSTRQYLAHYKPAYKMWATFDPVAIEFFNRIHYTYDDVSFVWTTSWRNYVNVGDISKHNLYSMWYNAGFRGKFGDPWKVNPDDQRDLNLNHAARAEEIKHYLENFAPDCKDYLIFDDNDYDFNRILSKKRFIKTDPDNGILYKHMKNALSIMGTWDEA